MPPLKPNGGSALRTVVSSATGPLTEEDRAQPGGSTRQSREVLLERRLTLLEGRLDQLSKQQSSRYAAWAAPAIGGGVTALVGGSAVLATHWFSARRQKRDEFFKRLQDCQGLTAEIAADAASVWRSSGKKAKADGLVSPLLSKLADLTDKVSILETTQPSFKVANATAEFRSIATLDIEDEIRKADPLKADRALAAGRLLSRRLGDAYLEVFG